MPKTAVDLARLDVVLFFFELKVVYVLIVGLFFNCQGRQFDA